MHYWQRRIRTKIRIFRNPIGVSCSPCQMHQKSLYSFFAQLQFTRSYKTLNFYNSSNFQDRPLAQMTFSIGLQILYRILPSTRRKILKHRIPPLRNQTKHPCNYFRYLIAPNPALK